MTALSAAKCVHGVPTNEECLSCHPRPEHGVTRTPDANGRKYDGGKDRWDLLPLGPVREIVKVLTFGAQKYAPNNWQKVEDFEERYYASLMRHLSSHREGEILDPESGLRHLSHAACCLMFLLWKELTKEKK